MSMETSATCGGTSTGKLAFCQRMKLSLPSTSSTLKLAGAPSLLERIASARCQGRRNRMETIVYPSLHCLLTSKNYSDRRKRENVLRRRSHEVAARFAFETKPEPKRYLISLRFVQKRHEKVRLELRTRHLQ